MKRIVFSVLLIGVLYLGTDKIFAQCRCEPTPTAQDHFKRSNVVFIGKVVEVKTTSSEDSRGYNSVIKFEVKQVWKRDLEKLVIVRVYGNFKSFEPNAELLLYADKGADGILETIAICCSGTKLLSVANKQGDFKAFKRMGEKPKKILDD